MITTNFHEFDSAVRCDALGFSAVRCDESTQGQSLGITLVASRDTLYVTNTVPGGLLDICGFEPDAKLYLVCLTQEVDDGDCESIPIDLRNQRSVHNALQNLRPLSMLLTEDLGLARKALPCVNVPEITVDARTAKVTAVVDPSGTIQVGDLLVYACDEIFTDTDDCTAVYTNATVVCLRGVDRVTLENEQDQEEEEQDQEEEEQDQEEEEQDQEKEEQEQEQEQEQGQEDIKGSGTTSSPFPLQQATNDKEKEKEKGKDRETKGEDKDKDKEEEEEQEEAENGQGLGFVSSIFAFLDRQLFGEEE